VCSRKCLRGTIPPLPKYLSAWMILVSFFSFSIV
jgi:hypothetical protein